MSTVPGLSLTDIQQFIADQHILTVDELKGPQRNAQIVWARQVAMYLARQLTNAPYQTIGIQFGGRHHGTVMHACQKVQSCCEQNTKTQESIAFIASALRNSTTSTQV